MSPRVRTRQGEFTTELAWSGSGSRSGITPAVGRTMHYPPPPKITLLSTSLSATIGGLKVEVVKVLVLFLATF
ncbi:hypothetical protein Hanom_Chr17g01527291 [Helianthus anomalus]